MSIEVLQDSPVFHTLLLLMVMKNYVNYIIHKKGLKRNIEIITVATATWARALQFASCIHHCSIANNVKSSCKCLS